MPYCCINNLKDLKYVCFFNKKILLLSVRFSDNFSDKHTPGYRLGSGCWNASLCLRNTFTDYLVRLRKIIRVA